MDGRNTEVAVSAIRRIQRVYGRATAGQREENTTVLNFAVTSTIALSSERLRRVGLVPGAASERMCSYFAVSGVRQGVPAERKNAQHSRGDVFSHSGHHRLPPSLSPPLVVLAFMEYFTN